MKKLCISLGILFMSITLTIAQDLATTMPSNGASSQPDSSTMSTKESKKESKKEKKAAKKNVEPQKGDIYFSPVPVFGANPAFGFIYGAGTTTSWFMGDPKTTSISNMLAGLAFTTKSQTIFTIKSSMYTEDNAWIFLGDWRFLNSSQPTFGIGTGPQSSKLIPGGKLEFDDNTFAKALPDAQMLEFRFIRFSETALKKISGNFYAGVGIHIDLYSNVKDNLTNLEPADGSLPVISSYEAYNQKYGFDSEKNSLVGVSLNGIYDTRDNQNFPYKGRYAFLSYHINPSFLGSDKNSSTLWAEYRDYYNFTPDHHNILGFWAFGNFQTSGTLPYLDLPALGWDQFAKSGRGYVQGRFRGQNLVYSELEYRKHIFGLKNSPDFFGMVAYVNGTTASSTSNNIRTFEYIEPGYGVGLRFMLSKKARSRLDIDYGLGNYHSSGLYIRLNETF